MNKKQLIIALIIIGVAGLIGCQIAYAPESSASTEPTMVDDVSLPENLTLQEAEELMADDSSIQLIDVRTAEEYAAGHVANAQLFPLANIATSIPEAYENKATKLIVYCRSGNRSGQAQRKLIELGYKNVGNAGGINNYQGELVK